MLRTGSRVARNPGTGAVEAAPVQWRHRQVAIGSSGLSGECNLGNRMRGLVLLIHGCNRNRNRNNGTDCGQTIARVFERHGLGTLLLRLPESPDPEHRRKQSEADESRERVLQLLAWLAQADDLSAYRCSLWGAGVGAAAVLAAASARPAQVHALVASGGRPDLAWPSLSLVQAPTLLIVGGDDVPSQKSNRHALALLQCEKRYEVIPGVVDLFGEPYAQQSMSAMAAQWLEDHTG